MTAKYFDQRSDFFRGWFEKGLTYEAHVAAGKEAHRARWHEAHELLRLTEAQRELLSGFTRRMQVLVVSGTWCGDCVRQVPILARIEEACPAVTLRLLDRDENPELRDELRIAGAMRVPVAVFLSEDFFECERFGDRTLAAYRGMAERQLGPACPIGPVPADATEAEATIQEWVDRFERVQLMLRLSPMLRERYGD